MRYFFAFLAAVALIVLVFVLVLRGFSGSKQPGSQTRLTDYAATDTVMRMTIEGPVNADQDHRSLSVTVGRAQNEFRLFQGYQGEVLTEQSYGNNETGYADFLRAIQLQGFNKGNPDPKRADDRGVCPLGKRIRFEIITGSDTVQSFYTTTCGSGTFGGSSSVIRRLFQKQIPDYSKLTRGLGFSQ